MYIINSYYFRGIGNIKNGQKLANIGFDPKKFGLNSLRSGASQQQPKTR